MTLRALGRALWSDTVLLRGGAVPVVALLACWALGFDQETGVTVAILAVIGAIVLLEVVAALLAHLRLREFIVEATVGVVYGFDLRPETAGPLGAQPRRECRRSTR